MTPFLIGNEWVVGAGSPIVSINPADGSTNAELGTASAGDVDAAVASAKSALANPAWRDLKPHERARYLGRISDALLADRERIARIQMRSNGKLLKECLAQVTSAAATFRYYASVCETLETSLTPERGEYISMTVNEPVGVVAAMTAWNSPLTLEAQKLAPILAAGNAAILKPSEVTPLVGLEYARIALEVGLPPGVLNVLTGAGDVGRQLVEHKGVDMVSFTGGTATGRSIATTAGTLLKPVVLELGGKSPNIVFSDADFDAAVRGIGEGIFSGGGQSCIAGSRAFVQRSIYDRFMEHLAQFASGYTAGPPDAASSRMGPLASFAHRQRVADYVDIGRAEGAVVEAGGRVPDRDGLGVGAYYTATLLSGVSNSSRICQEEIFGPVVVALPFDDEDDLISQANDSDFGLASGIWTGDYRRAWRVARALRAGTVWINTYKELSITTPFGGVKQSGIGREKGIDGMKSYTANKSIYWGLTG